MGLRAKARSALLSQPLKSINARGPRTSPQPRSSPLHHLQLSSRRPDLDSPQPKEILEQVIERTRRTHNFLLYACVLMPEHIHLLLNEPNTHPLSSILRVIKGESSKLLKGTRTHLWQARYYDFNVFTTRKFKEKIQYIHRNPVTRGLVSKPEDYRWSSFNHYATGEPIPIEIESEWTARHRQAPNP